jgi:ribosome maturation factor RimP
VEPLVRARRCTLYDLEMVGRGATQVLRVTIDAPSGVDTDTLEAISRLVSRALDEAELIPGRYSLEVSSPGLERSLKRPEHFASVVGRDDLTARVKVKEGDEVNVLEGVVAEAGEDGFRLETSEGDAVDVAYDQVVSARTVFHWGPAARRAGRGT